jgi:CheY-like chemotaxis protein
VTRILVVEDNEPSCDMLVRRLERRGFVVLVSRDGLEAVEVATAQKPDLVLMDMSLPKLDGYEATRRLKADTATSAIPVVGLSAHAMAGDREKALAAGCDEYETKPIEFEQLIGKIQTALRGRGDS